jgi:hypothetical protein
MSDGEQPYSARPALYRLPGERIPEWRCRCNVPSYRRHLEPWQCVTVHQVELWRARHPGSTCSERTARALCWLENSFGNA